jgi:hypothetical protein
MEYNEKKTEENLTYRNGTNAIREHTHTHTHTTKRKRDKEQVK